MLRFVVVLAFVSVAFYLYGVVRPSERREGED